MFRWPAIAVLVFLLPFTAQAANVAISISPVQKTVVTGQKIDFTITASNPGPDDVNFTTAIGSLDVQQQLVSVTAPAGWNCGNDTRQDGFYCTAEKFAAGSEAVFRASILIANHIAGTTFEFGVSVGAGGPDDLPGDNNASSHITVMEAPSTAALSIRAIPERSTVAPGETATITLDVHNEGPDAATNVLVQALYGSELTAQMQGSGWTCTERACTRPLLVAGQSAPLTFSLPATAERIFQARFLAGAALTVDPNGMDNFADATIGIGDAASWRRILLPLSFAETPGALGSLWKTEITALIDSAAAIELEPKPLCIPPRACPVLPLRRPFDFLAVPSAFRPSMAARFVYVRAADEPKLTLNIRVRDLTRTAETWGTEVPVVREHEWRTESIVLAPLPVDPLFRLTLRVYSFDARTDDRVALRIYADQEAEPRATVVRTLATGLGTFTTALLPAYPGYLQLDPLAEAGEVLAGAKTMWIRVEPLAPGRRFWAFASVTNNPTGHVTTVTP